MNSLASSGIYPIVIIIGIVILLRFAFVILFPQERESEAEFQFSKQRKQANLAKLGKIVDYKLIIFAIFIIFSLFINLINPTLENLRQLILIISGSIFALLVNYLHVSRVNKDKNNG